MLWPSQNIWTLTFFSKYLSNLFEPFYSISSKFHLNVAWLSLIHWPLMTLITCCITAKIPTCLLATKKRQRTFCIFLHYRVNKQGASTFYCFDCTCNYWHSPSNTRETYLYYSSSIILLISLNCNKQPWQLFYSWYHSGFYKKRFVE